MAVWSTASAFEMHYGARRLDAEFARPHYVLAESRCKTPSFDLLGDLGSFVPGPFGSAFHVKDYVDSSPFRYIRGQDVNNFSIADESPRFVSDAAFQRLEKYEVRENDLMISVVGTLGQVSICTEFDVPSVFSCKSTILRGSSVDPCYLAAYLNSKPGQDCLLRRQRGAIQMGLNIEDLRSVPVPRFGRALEEQIGALVRKAFSCKRTAKSAYTQAQQLLEGELGLDKLEFEKPVGYTARFSELETARRADAEFFHSKYEPTLQCIRNYRHGYNSLFEISQRVFPNFDPNRASGIHNYIEIGDVAVGDGSYTFNQVDASQLPANAKIAVKGGEVLLSQVRPTRGAIAILDDEMPRNTICSGAFYVFNPNETKNREVVWLYLRSFRSVFEKFCGGTSYPTIEPRYFAKFPVPRFAPAFAERIRSLVFEARQKKAESKSLLEQAKAHVEQLIEEAVAKA